RRPAGAAAGRRVPPFAGGAGTALGRPGAAGGNPFGRRLGALPGGPIGGWPRGRTGRAGEHRPDRGARRPARRTGRAGRSEGGGCEGRVWVRDGGGPGGRAVSAPPAVAAATATLKRLLSGRLPESIAGKQVRVTSDAPSRFPAPGAAIAAQLRLNLFL